MISSSGGVSGLSPVHKTIERLHGLLLNLPLLLSHALTNPLLPRIVLNYFASISCGLYLLQHAIWSVRSGEQASDLDLEALRRWVDEGDVHTYAREVQSIQAGDGRARVELDSLMVYGAKL